MTDELSHASKLVLISFWLFFPFISCCNFMKFSNTSVWFIRYYTSSQAKELTCRWVGNEGDSWVKMSYKPKTVIIILFISKIPLICIFWLYNSLSCFHFVTWVKSWVAILGDNFSLFAGLFKLLPSFKSWLHKDYLNQMKSRTPFHIRRI